MTILSKKCKHNFFNCIIYFKTYVIVFTERDALSLDFQNLVSGAHAFQEKCIAPLLSSVMTNQNYCV